MTDKIAEHARWLVNIQLDQLNSFRIRTLEILGFNGLILVFLWSQVEDRVFGSARIELDLTVSIIILAYSLLMVIQLSLFIYVSIPRKSVISLKLETTEELIVENLAAYISQVGKYVGTRANITRWFYRILVAQTLLIIIGIISIEGILPMWLKYFLIPILVFIIGLLLTAKESWIN